MDVTSSRKGKSNLGYRDNLYLDDSGLAFVPGSSSGVVKTRIGYSRTLKDTVTSYRGKRDTSQLDTPQLLLQAAAEYNAKPKYDTGHPFFSRKESQYVSHRRAVLRGIGGAYWNGPVIATVPYDVGQTYTGWSSADLSSLRFSDINLARGTTAIARCEPTKNPFSLSRAVLEALRDFPEIPIKALKDSRSKSEAARNLGSEYLNVVFGILPTVDDLYSLAKRVVNFSHIVEQYQRDLGRPVRRSYSFPTETISYKSMSGTSTQHGIYAGYLTGVNNTGVFYQANTPYVVSQQETVTEKYWFKGSFEYYLDPLFEKLGPAGEAVAMANQVLGFGGSVKTIWELTPWSWLIDWFFGVKDLLSITEKIANDSLVLRYGYLMRTSVRSYEVAISGLKPVSGMNNPTQFTTTTQIVEKQRVRSTPYGFGLNVGQFTGQQWAILAALGLTKAPKTLF